MTSDSRPLADTHRGDRPLGTLFRDLATELRTLVSQELQLASAEAKEQARIAAKDVTFVAAGGGIAYAGAIVLLIGLGFLLAEVVPLWLAFLIVGVAVAILGYALLQYGVSALKKHDFTLRRTVDTLTADRAWLELERKQIQDDPRRLGATHDYTH